MIGIFYFAMTDLIRVAIVGRPNVGKSSIFNRFAGKHRAITSPIAGTTRDRLEQIVAIGATKFVLADVGGIEIKPGTQLDSDIQLQVRHAIDDAELILFVVDSRAAITAEDFAAAELLRKSGKQILFVANKADRVRESDLVEFARFGLGLPRPVSAVHGEGLDELAVDLAKQVRKLAKERKKKTATPDPDIAAKIAIVGRPNVGKSSLLNHLLGEQRFIVSAEPLTTRDTNDAVIESGGKKFLVLDTAGIRRRGRIGTGLDYFATGRSLNAIAEADVALLLIDGKEGVTAQDQHVAQFVIESGASLIIVINKIDTWTGDYETSHEQALKNLAREFQFARFAPAMLISAQTGRNVEHLFPQILAVKAERERLVPKHELNQFLRRVAAEHLPGGAYGRVPPRIGYATQAESAPPKFILFVNRPQAFHFSYRRYLENRIREEYGFAGTPIRIEFREKSGRKEKVSDKPQQPRSRKNAAKDSVTAARPGFLAGEKLEKFGRTGSRGRAATGSTAKSAAKKPAPKKPARGKK